MQDISGDPLILKSKEGGTVVLTFNRPSSFNPLSTGMMTAFETELDACAGDSSVSAVIIRAEGKCFSPGHDLKEIQAHRNDPDGGRAFYEGLFEQSSRLMRKMIALPQPVIAEVQGIATASGCQLVAACDLAIASEEARFGVNGIDVGFFCSTPAVPLSRNIGNKKAFELLATGRLMPAEEACAAGLVNKVVPAAGLRAAGKELADKIAEKSGAIIALGKDAFYKQIELDREAAYLLASKVMVENLLDPDAKEGMTAFLEKRKPQWENR